MSEKMAKQNLAQGKKKLLLLVRETDYNANNLHKVLLKEIKKENGRKIDKKRRTKLAKKNCRRKQKKLLLLVRETGGKLCKCSLPSNVGPLPYLYSILLLLSFLEMV